MLINIARAQDGAGRRKVNEQESRKFDRLGERSVSAGENSLSSVVRSPRDGRFHDKLHGLLAGERVQM